MPIDHRARLAAIRRFDQLIPYLRDEMGWPIDGDDFEKLTFEYTAEELGIDEKNAAKIQEIKRLRPLSPRQPWGIFFVKFEPKRLPVGALRRILSQVALKKRASANSAERTAWAAGDLLFVSNYGEGAERQISFAHFSQAQDGHDLPTLKVLGWDNLDTGLHLDGVAQELTQHLAWPESDTAIEAWRECWRSAFTVVHGEVVRTSKELSICLAALAGDIRDRIKSALAIETDRGPLTKLMKAFQEALVHDLDADGFADMYAQTIAYGLLSARIADPHKKTVDDFAGHMRTNPFLRELMETFLKVGGRRGKAGGPGIDFDELGVSEVVELLDDANMEAVVRDFGDKNPLEDPVIHFYELFLKEYDAKKRMQRGVFDTPRPVVSYLVRSVDGLLRTEFGLKDGLADTTTWGDMAKRHKGLKIPNGVDPGRAFVQILDPATGTGTFLVEAVDVIHRTMVTKWEEEAGGPLLADAQRRWNEYVPKHLLPRLHGYELLMAPYAICHLKIGLKLYETGYRFGSDERARIYLTNALEPASDLGQQTLAGMFPALAHEAQAVNAVKMKQRFTVVVGNPPYSGQPANEGEWIGQLLRSKLLDGAPSVFEIDGARLDEPNTKWLNDDYVKFLRLAQAAVASSGAGVAGLITNHSWLDNPTFRGLRQSIAHTFSRAFILDLHGNTKRKETAPDGSKDENVFDIQQGVAISILVAEHVAPTISHSDLCGLRTGKYGDLEAGSVQRTEWAPLAPQPPLYLWRPFDSSNADEYRSYITVTEVFGSGDDKGRGSSWAKGLATTKDHLFISFDRREAFRKIGILAASSSEISNAQAASELDLEDTPYFRVADARREIRRGEWKNRVCSVTYRPFDNRSLYWHPELYDIGRGASSKRVMSHMFKPNLALVTSRMTKGEDFAHVFASRFPVEVISLSSKTSNNAFVFPLRYYQDFKAQLGLGFEEDVSSINLSSSFLADLRMALGLRLSKSNLPEGVAPEEIFHYAYAVLHSPGYRSRYAEFLRIDFPRLPLTGDLELFRALARLGGELVALQLLESPKIDRPITEVIGGRNPEVEKPAWSRNTVWVDKAQTSGFEGVPEAVWNFHIGGYQVCEKWLKDRKGRTLLKADIEHYQKIVVALAETIRLMKDIDVVIERHGGWPGAFAAGKSGHVREPLGEMLVAEPGPSKKRPRGRA